MQEGFVVVDHAHGEFRFRCYGAEQLTEKMAAAFSMCRNTDVAAGAPSAAVIGAVVPADVVNAIFDHNGICHIVDQRGVVMARFQIVYERVVNSQYPTPLSRDGTVIYIGTWQGSSNALRSVSCFTNQRGVERGVE